MSKIKHFIDQSWLLIVASFCFGLLLAGTNYALSARIERNRTAKLYSRTGDLLNSFNAMVNTQLPKAEVFEECTEIEIMSYGKSQAVKIIKALSVDEQTVVGWSFNASGSGFADKIELVVAVDPNFKTIAGFDVLSSNETPGFGDQIKYDYFRSQFEGAPAEALKLVSLGEPTDIENGEKYSVVASCKPGRVFIYKVVLEEIEDAYCYVKEVTLTGSNG